MIYGQHLVKDSTGMEATTQASASGPVTVGVNYAAGFLGVHKNTVYRWIKTEKLAARFYLGAWRIETTALLKAASSDQRRRATQD